MTFDYLHRGEKRPNEAAFEEEGSGRNWDKRQGLRVHHKGEGLAETYRLCLSVHVKSLESTSMHLWRTGEGTKDGSEVLARLNKTLLIFLRDCNTAASKIKFAGESLAFASLTAGDQLQTHGRNQPKERMFL